MCAILDANVVGEVFGRELPPAGKAFFRRVSQGKIRLVIGGKLRCELASPRFAEWARQAVLAGSLVSFNDDKVNARTEELQASEIFESDDVHVIALAQISGARLLYSNDQDLHTDFKNRKWIADPRGKIYSTRDTKNVTPGHRLLLNNPDLCPSC